MATRTAGAVALALILAATQSSAAPAVSVVDGDTFDLDGTRYRIFGIDAPETGQSCARANGGNWKCGEAATAELERIVFNAAQIECTRHGEDGYGRVIGACIADDVDIGRDLVLRGFAWSFVKYEHPYDAEEGSARSKHVGIWQAPSKTAWQYREDRWNAAGQLAPDPNCPIKGNINGDDEHIYHPPWSPWYDKTKIDEAKGERWFCDEAQAVKAGWRAPNWGRGR